MSTCPVALNLGIESEQKAISSNCAYVQSACSMQSLTASVSRIAVSFSFSSESRGTDFGAVAGNRPRALVAAIAALASSAEGCAKLLPFCSALKIRVRASLARLLSTGPAVSGFKLIRLTKAGELNADDTDDDEADGAEEDEDEAEETDEFAAGMIRNLARLLTSSPFTTRTK